MISINKTKLGKWQVTDNKLGVDKTFDTHAEARSEVDRCNSIKLAQMTGRNPECKRCGLLKSTVEATGKECVPDIRMGTTLKGVHDFPFDFSIGKFECDECHDTGEVATDESDGEGHYQSGVGTQKCECRITESEHDDQE